MGEAKDVIEDVVEPYLIQKGLINRTPRGRTLAKKSFEDLKKNDRKVDNDKIWS